MRSHCIPRVYRYNAKVIVVYAFVKVLYVKEIDLSYLMLIKIPYCVRSCVDEDMTACPVFSNTTIIEQPANFFTLHDRYTNAAVSFIKQQSG